MTRTAAMLVWTGMTLTVVVTVLVPVVNALNHISAILAVR